MPAEARQPEVLSVGFLSRVWEAYKSVAGFFDWVHWGKDAANAVNSQQPVPAPPDTNIGTQVILDRIEGLEVLARSITATVKPDYVAADALRPGPGLRSSVITGIANQSVDLYNLNDRLRLLADIHKQLEDLKTTCRATAMALEDLVTKKHVPDPTESINHLWYDVSVTLFNEIARVERVVEDRQRSVIEVYEDRVNAYARWQRSARQQLADFEAQERKVKRDINSVRESGKDFVAGTSPQRNRPAVDSPPPPDLPPPPDITPSRPEHPPPRPNGGGSHTIPNAGGVLGRYVSVFTGRIENSLTPVEYNYVPPELWVVEPPEDAGFDLPAGGEVTFVPTFGANLSSLDIWGIDENGNKHPIVLWQGSCGKMPRPETYRNGFSSPLRVFIAAYDGELERNHKRVPDNSRIQRTEQGIHKDIAFFGWGYRARSNAPSGHLNDVVLLAIRADATPAPAQTADGWRVNLSDSPSWAIATYFPGEQTTVKFTKLNAPSTEPISTDGAKGEYTTFTLGSGGSDEFTVSVSGQGQAGDALRWEVTQWNHFIRTAIGVDASVARDRARAIRAVISIAPIEQTSCPSVPSFRLR